MSYELEYRLALRPYEYVNVRVTSETMVTLSYDLDQLNERAKEIFEAYNALDAARSVQDVESLEAAKSALGSLGTTVVEQVPSPVVPAPEDPVQPLWERPPTIPQPGSPKRWGEDDTAQPSNAVVDTSIDDFDF